MAHKLQAPTRYTIPRLRELSLSSGGPFDLSKFSFDAVRAGVVPALSQCTSEMATGRRGWSSETMASMEDCVVYPGNSAQLPVRQPANAPGDPLVQKDLGFARFLKKHASPTHQRVTAGGRIVPMETRPAPPPFTLKNAGSTSNTAGQAQPYGKNHVAPMVAPTANFPNTNNRVNDAAFTANANVGPGIGFPSTELPNLAYGMSQTPFSPVLHPTQYASGICDPIGMQSASMFYNNPVPLVSPIPLYPNPYAMTPYSNGLWSFPDHYVMPVLQAPLTPILDLEQQLSQANAEFDELDRQLKELDRDRAMSNYDRTRAAQRVEIVNQRAKAKENVGRLRNALSIEPGTVPANISYPNRRLNVEAATWIPPSKNNQAVPIQHPREVEKKATPSHDSSSFAKTVAQTQYDPFVAVVPPESPEIEGVDEWGARLGRAPPELERQQSDMAESMMSARSSSSLSSTGDDRDVYMAQPCASQRTCSRDNGNTGLDDGVSEEASSDAGEWLPTNPGRAPPEVEKDYALQLDAMRKPKGITTHVRTSEGQVFSVAGQALIRPPPSSMTEFERKYWSQEQEALTQESNKVPAHNQENSVEYSERTHGMSTHIEAAGNMYNGRISTSRKDHLKTLADIFKGSTNEIRPSLNEATEYSTENLAMKSTLVPSDILTGLRGSLSQSPEREAEIDLRDSMNNKTYSSVAVQNIHAISRLPHGLDGAIDKMQKVASAAKVKSPRILHRSTPTGNAWYGPFRRDFLERLEKSDDLAGQSYKRTQY